MKVATVKLMGEVLRIELRSDDREACAKMEIAIVKQIQGVSTMTYPDGATIARKNCTAKDAEVVTELLDEYGWKVNWPSGTEKFLGELVAAGWRVSIEPESLNDLKGPVRVALQNRHSGPGAPILGYRGTLAGAISRAWAGERPDWKND